MTNRKLRFLSAIATGLIAALGAGPIRADDTDVYLHPKTAANAQPLVMLVLDWRASLGDSKTCAIGSGCDAMRTAGYIPGVAGTSTTFIDVIRGALKQVLDPLSGIQVGLMMSHANVNNCQNNVTKGCSNGAYVLQGFTPVTGGTDDPKTFQLTGEDPGKVKLFTILDNLPPSPSGTTEHPFQGKELYFELFRYLTGQGIYNGHVGFEDFGEKPNTATNLDKNFPKISWDTSIETPGNKNTYITPISSDSQCQKIFVINFMFQVSQQEDDSDAAITDTKANGGMAGISLASPNNNFATVIQYMNQIDLADGTFGTAPNLTGKQNVVSYFIVDSTKINTTTKGYASAGGTGAPLVLSDDPAVLVNTLNNIFNSILSVSTTFVAPSVPVNVFNRSQIVNEVFFALFDADPNSLPLWPGNLKKLVLGTDPVSGSKELQDVNGAQAIDVDGRIKHEAVTFWTDTVNLPPPNANLGEIAGADGRSVQRGASGQKIPGFVSGSPGLSNSSAGARQIFTEDTSVTAAANKLLAVNVDPITTAPTLWTSLKAMWNPAVTTASYALASATDQNHALNQLRFIRGLASVSSGQTTDTTTKLNWMLSDPLHSRPRPINYGARTGYSMVNPDIRILMATNDGEVHLIRDTAPGTTTPVTQSGVETWAFIPRESMSLVDRLLQNNAGTPIHPLLVDGSPAVIIKDNNNDGTINTATSCTPTTDCNDKVFAYFGLRRGGKSYYALDISDPDNPKFMWKITKGDPGFEEMSQSWSTPEVGQIKVGSTTKDVLVFGGGYNGDDLGDNVVDSGDTKFGKDTANRAQNNVSGAGSPYQIGTNDNEGTAIYVVDALTGALIWKAAGALAATNTSITKVNSGMVDSIAADVTAADTDGDGLIDRIYAGDTAGVVWRADLAGTSVSGWTITKFADIGRHANSGNANDRRFFNRPDLVQTKDNTGNFDAVLIGSGDRENPQDTTVTNRFYLFKDRNTTSGSPPSTAFLEGNLADLTSNCVATSSCNATTTGNLVNGWFFNLLGSGEKNLAESVTLGGVVFFTTFQPGGSVSGCSLSEGTGKVFAVNLADATAVYNYDTTNDTSGITLERSSTLASGGIPVEVVPLGKDLILVQGQASGLNTAATSNIVSTGTRTSWKTFWYDLFR